MGVSALLTYNAGLFASDLGRSIGLSRTLFGVAFFLTTVVIAAVLPLVGSGVDRLGARVIAMSGALTLALAFAALGMLTTNVGSYVALMILLGLLGAASTPVSYTRAVSANFDSRRGMALGLTQVGIGVSATIVPPMIGATIAAHGWRVGYYALAGIAACGLIPAFLGLRAATALAPAAQERSEDFGVVLKDGLFWRQMLAFVIMALGFVGIITHFAPMLRDAGLPAVKTARMVGLVGLSTMVSRVAVGRLLDKIHPPRVAACACIICAGGCLILALGNMRTAPIAAIVLGLARYGRAYAWQFAAFIVAAGISGIWVGAIADHTSSYHLALLAAMVLLLIAGGLFWQLPRDASTDTPASSLGQMGSSRGS
jgi:MFS family permease